MTKISRTLFRIAALVALGTLSVACLERQIAEVTPSLATDREAVTPKAEGSEGELLKDTLYITSNRSWSADVTYDGQATTDWVNLSVDEHENISKASDRIMLPFSIGDNPYNITREAVIHFHYEGIEKTVTITQPGIEYRMEPSIREKKGISDLANEFNFTLDTNIPWKIDVKEGSTMDVTVDPVSGVGYSEITVSVGDNSDFVVKNATLVISADQGYVYTPVEITLQQKACNPFITIDRERTKSAITPIETSNTIYFATNGDWTASLKDVTGDVTLATESGTKGLQNELVVNFGANTGSVLAGTSKAATIVLESNGVTDEITVTQKYWYKVELIFHDGASLKSKDWPLLSPMAYSDCPSSSTKTKPEHMSTLVTAELSKYSGLYLSVFFTKGFWRNTNQGFDCGNAEGDYITTPVVNGKTLACVGVKSGRTSFPARITDTSGNTLTGGDPLSGWEKNVENDWYLSDTAASTMYRITFTTTTTQYLFGLMFYYE